MLYLGNTKITPIINNNKAFVPPYITSGATVTDKHGTWTAVTNKEYEQDMVHYIFDGEKEGIDSWWSGNTNLNYPIYVGLEFPKLYQIACVTIYNENSSTSATFDCDLEGLDENNEWQTLEAEIEIEKIPNETNPQIYVLYDKGNYKGFRVVFNNSTANWGCCLNEIELVLV